MIRHSKYVPRCFEYIATFPSAWVFLLVLLVQFCGFDCGLGDEFMLNSARVIPASWSASVPISASVPVPASASASASVPVPLGSALHLSEARDQARTKKK